MKKEGAVMRAQHDLYREEVLAKGRCWVSHIIPHACDGPMDPCHMIDAQVCRAEISKARIKGLNVTPKEEAKFVYDPRNGVPICRAWHHKLDNGFLRIYRSQFPADTLIDIMRFIGYWETMLEMPYSRLLDRLDKRFPKEAPK